MCNSAASPRAKPSKPELADIVRAHAGAYRAVHTLSAEQSQALGAIATCRTPARGGYVETCQRCGTSRAVYHSCSNRHCPKCQSLASRRWCEARRADLLPIVYFHVVFTLPHELNPLVRRHPRLAYAALFAAASETLACFGADPKRLGGQIGVTAILHTWQQTLAHHVHLHCLVTGGALVQGRCEDRWVSTSRRFLFPVRALAKVFRGKYLAALTRAIERGQIEAQHADLISSLRAKKWIVYAKPPAAGPDQVLAYLARYVQRTAISNDRILEVTDGLVRFSYRDRADGNCTKVMRLGAHDFLARFLTHILPKGFMRVRHFGLLANRGRTQKLARCRQLLDAAPPPQPRQRETAAAMLAQVTGVDVTRCPACGLGRMHVTLRLARSGRPPPQLNTS